MYLLFAQAGIADTCLQGVLKRAATDEPTSYDRRRAIFARYADADDLAENLIWTPRALGDHEETGRLAWDEPSWNALPLQSDRGVQSAQIPRVQEGVTPAHITRRHPSPPQSHPSLH